jgi:SAM-dependent methyltransferase
LQGGYILSNRSLAALAQRIALHIESLVPQGRARCLDIGCGDMTLVEALEARRSRTNKSRMDWSCIDVHRAPECDDTRWCKYRQFDGRTIPYADDEFDVALLCDVLHHAPEDAARLLAEAGRVARHVLVKDDFIDDLRTVGRAAQRSFTREGFVRLAREQRLVITALDSGLDSSSRCCEPVPGALLRPDSQFIAVLRTG